jgi:hypothetical protein
MKMSKQIPIGGALPLSVDKNSGKSRVSGYGTCASPLATRCREKNDAISSGHRRKNARPLSERPTRYQRRMAPGSGPKGEDEARSGGVLSRCKTMEPCAVRQARRSGRAELRQENAFTQRAVFLASLEDCQGCPLREQCLRPGAKGNRARRLSAVRRLLPAPATLLPQTGVLQATRWRDVAGRALRRTWTAHWRKQFVEVLPLAENPQRGSPPPRSPRAIRSHQRWSWEDRLARNAWCGPPSLRVTVAGVPSSLAVS